MDSNHELASLRRDLDELARWHEARGQSSAIFDPVADVHVDAARRIRGILTISHAMEQTQGVPDSNPEPDDSPTVSLEVTGPGVPEIVRMLRDITDRRKGE